MLDTALKALELLLNKLKEGSTPDKKRETLAKQLLQIYLDVDELVSRGREILALYNERPSTSGVAVTLLTLQLRTLQNLKDHADLEPVASIMTLHLPDLSKRFGFAIDEKMDRVWIGLDLLVSDGETLDAAEWASRMESRMHPEDDPTKTGRKRKVRRELQSIPVLPLSRLGNLQGMRKWRPNPNTPPNTTVIGSPDEIRKGHEVLDALASSAEELRTFLLQKFKLEDVL